MHVSINIEGVKQTGKELDKFNDNIKRGLKREIAAVTNNVRNEAVGKAPVHTGNLRRSITVVLNKLSGSVQANAPYAYDVEFGQKPGKWPVVSDLMFWVRKKINPGKKRLNSVTFLVGKKIFKQGTDPQPYFYDAVKRHENRFYNRVEQIVRKA